MRFLISAFLLVVSVGSPARAGEPVPTHWLAGGTVYYAARPSVVPQLFVHRASEADWSYLQIDLAYEGIAEQTRAVQALYPDLQVRWVPARGYGTPHIEVTALGLSADSKWTQYANGPVLSHAFRLSKAQTTAFLAASDAGISVTGTIRAPIPEPVVIEDVSLPARTCSRLLANGETIRGVILSSSRVLSEISRMDLDHPETRAGLRTSLFRDCLDLREVDGATGFESFLSRTARIRKDAGPVRGTFRSPVPEDKTAAFEVTLVRKTNVIGMENGR
jgi:hypothetical protein